MRPRLSCTSIPTSPVSKLQLLTERPFIWKYARTPLILIKRPSVLFDLARLNSPAGWTFDPLLVRRSWKTVSRMNPRTDMSQMRKFSSVRMVSKMISGLRGAPRPKLSPTAVAVSGRNSGCSAMRFRSLVHVCHHRLIPQHFRSN